MGLLGQAGLKGHGQLDQPTRVGFGVPDEGNKVFYRLDNEHAST